MFGLSLALGAVQIATGFVLNGLSKWKANPLDAIFNNFSWVVIFLGIGLVAAAMLAKNAVLKTVGTYVALLGVLFLFLGGTVAKKGFKKVTGGLGNLYGMINVASDVLSYSRIFGLGLTSGVIALVFNEIASIIAGKGNAVGIIIAALFLIVGHTLNVAINVLGAYVHNSRLQYIEFFSKFYEGGGRAFSPLASKTKYIYLDN